MRRSFVKELFITALLFMVIMFTLGILLYDFIPQNQAAPESIEYTPDSTVTATLQEIMADTSTQGSDTTSNSTTTESLLKSYSIGKSDLKTYASKKAFESGKTDPFSEYVEPENTVEDGNTVGNTTSTIPNTTTNSTGSSIGTFFESSSSK